MPRWISAGSISEALTAAQETRFGTILLRILRDRGSLEPAPPGYCRFQRGRQYCRDGDDWCGRSPPTWTAAARKGVRPGNQKLRPSSATFPPKAGAAEVRRRRFSALIAASFREVQIQPGCLIYTVMIRRRTDFNSFSAVFQRESRLD